MKSKKILILVQFFLIVFIYHLLRDIKDTLVVTSSDVGAQVIPFIKVWAMLPMAILSSFLFAKLYAKWGRNGALYATVSFLLLFYALFAFFIYPQQHRFHLSSSLETWFPQRLCGLAVMIRFWSFTLFYLFAEVWSILVLSVLFWGGVNDMISRKEALSFYPLCILTGNISGFFSGQCARHLCHYFNNWQEAIQVMTGIIVVGGVIIMIIASKQVVTFSGKSHKIKAPFKENMRAVFSSSYLIAISVLVVGFALANNLIEVVWKGQIKEFYTTPKQYNAYMSQVTSIVGLSATLMFLGSRWLFSKFHWSKIALLTPAILLTTSFLFFSGKCLGQEALSPSVILTLGSIHFVCAMTAKYTLFDASKEMAFLEIDEEKRLRSKSIVDSIGSRLGKSGASGFHQGIIILVGASSSYVPFVALLSLLTIGASLIAARHLGKKREMAPLSESA